MKVEFEGSVEKVIGEMQAFLGTPTSGVHFTGHNMVKEEKKSPKTEPKKVEDAKVETKTEAPTTETPKAAVTYQMVADRIGKAVGKLGKPVIKEKVLAALGVAQPKEIKESDYPKVIEILNALEAAKG